MEKGQSSVCLNMALYQHPLAFNPDTQTYLHPLPCVSTKELPLLPCQNATFQSQSQWSGIHIHAHTHTLKTAQGWPPLVLQGQQSTQLPENEWYLKRAWYLIL